MSFPSTLSQFSSIGTCTNPSHCTASRLPPYPPHPSLPKPFLESLGVSASREEFDHEHQRSGVPFGFGPRSSHRSFCLECFVEALRHSHDEDCDNSPNMPTRNELLPLSACVSSIENVHQLLCDTVLDNLFGMAHSCPELHLLATEEERYNAVAAYKSYCSATMAWYTSTVARIQPYLDNLLLLCANQRKEDFDAFQKNGSSGDYHASPYYLRAIGKKGVQDFADVDGNRAPKVATSVCKCSERDLSSSQDSIISTRESEEEELFNDPLQMNGSHNTLWLKWQKSIQNFTKLVYLVVENAVRCDKIRSCIVLEDQHSEFFCGKFGNLLTENAATDKIFIIPPHDSVFGRLLHHTHQRIKAFVEDTAQSHRHRPTASATAYKNRVAINGHEKEEEEETNNGLEEGHQKPEAYFQTTRRTDSLELPKEENLFLTQDRLEEDGSFEDISLLRAMQMVTFVTDLLKDTSTEPVVIPSEREEEHAVQTDIPLPFLLFSSFSNILYSSQMSEPNAGETVIQKLETRRIPKTNEPESVLGFQKSLAILPIPRETLEILLECFLQVSALCQETWMSSGNTKKAEIFHRKNLIVTLHASLLGGIYCVLSDFLHPSTLQDNENSNSVKEEGTEYTVEWQRECNIAEICSLLSKPFQAVTFEGGEPNENIYGAPQEGISLNSKDSSFGASLISILFSILKSSSNISSDDTSRLRLETLSTFKSRRKRKHRAVKKMASKDERRRIRKTSLTERRRASRKINILFSTSQELGNGMQLLFDNGYSVLKLLWSESDILTTCLVLLAPDAPRVPEGFRKNPFFRCVNPATGSIDGRSDPYYTAIRASCGKSGTDDLIATNPNENGFPPPVLGDAMRAGVPLDGNVNAQSHQPVECMEEEEEDQHSLSVRVFSQASSLLTDLLPLVWNTLPFLCSMYSVSHIGLPSSSGVSANEIMVTDVSNARYAHSPSKQENIESEQFLDSHPYAKALSTANGGMYDNVQSSSAEKRSVLFLELIHVLVCTAHSEMQALEEWCDEYTEWWRRSLAKDHFQREADEASRHRALEEKRQRKKQEKMALLEEFQWEGGLAGEAGRYGAQPVEDDDMYLLGAQDEDNEGDTNSSISSECSEEKHSGAPAGIHDVLHSGLASADTCGVFSGERRRERSASPLLQRTGSVIYDASVVHFPPPLHIAEYRQMLLASFEILQSGIQTLESFANHAYQFLHDMPTSSDTGDPIIETKMGEEYQAYNMEQKHRTDGFTEKELGKPVERRNEGVLQRDRMECVKDRLREFLQLVVQLLNEMTIIWKRLTNVICLQPLPAAHQSYPGNEVTNDDEAGIRTGINGKPIGIEKVEKDAPAYRRSFSFSPSSALKVQALTDLFMLHLLEDSACDMDTINNPSSAHHIPLNDASCGWSRWQKVFLGPYYTERLREQQHTQQIQGRMLPSAQNSVVLNEQVYFLMDAMPIWLRDAELFFQTSRENMNQISLPSFLYLYLPSQLHGCHEWESHPSLLPSLHVLTVMCIKLKTPGAYPCLMANRLYSLFDYHALQLLAQTMELLSCASCIHSSLPFFVFLIRRPQMPPVTLNTSTFPQEDVYWTAFFHDDDSSTARSPPQHCSTTRSVRHQFYSLLLVWLNVLLLPQCSSTPMENSGHVKDALTPLPFVLSGFSSPIMLCMGAAVVQEVLLEHLQPAESTAGTPELMAEDVKRSFSQGPSPQGDLHPSSLLAVESEKCTAVVLITSALVLYVAKNSELCSKLCGQDDSGSASNECYPGETTYRDMRKGRSYQGSEASLRWIQEIISLFLFSSSVTQNRFPSSFSREATQQSQGQGPSICDEGGAIPCVLSWSHALQESLKALIMEDQTEENERFSPEGFDHATKRENATPIRSSSCALSRWRAILGDLESARKILLTCLCQLSFLSPSRCGISNSHETSSHFDDSSFSSYVSQQMPFWVHHAVCVEDLLDASSAPSAVYSRSRVAQTHAYGRSLLAYSISRYLLQSYFTPPPPPPAQPPSPYIFRKDARSIPVQGQLFPRLDRGAWLRRVFCRWMMESLSALAELPLPPEWTVDAGSSHVSHLLRYHSSGKEHNRERYINAVSEFFSLFRTLLLSCACYMRCPVASGSFMRGENNKGHSNFPVQALQSILSLPVLSEIISAGPSLLRNRGKNGWSEKREREKNMETASRAIKRLCFFLNQASVHALYEMIDSKDNAHSFCPYAKEVSKFVNWWTQMRDTGTVSQNTHDAGSRTWRGDGVVEQGGAIMDQLLVSLMRGTQRNPIPPLSKQKEGTNDSYSQTFVQDQMTREEAVEAEDWCSSWSSHFFIMLLVFSSTASTSSGLNGLMRSLRERRTTRGTVRYCHQSILRRMQLCADAGSGGNAENEHHEDLGSCSDSLDEEEDRKESPLHTQTEKRHLSTAQKNPRQQECVEDGAQHTHSGKSSWYLENFELQLLSSMDTSGIGPAEKDISNCTANVSQTNSLFHDLLRFLSQHFLTRCRSEDETQRGKKEWPHTHTAYHLSLLSWDLMEPSEEEEDSGEAERQKDEGWGSTDDDDEETSLTPTTDDLRSEGSSTSCFSNGLRSCPIGTDKYSESSTIPNTFDFTLNTHLIIPQREQHSSAPLLSGFQVWSNCVSLLFRHIVHAHLAATFHTPTTQVVTRTEANAPAHTNGSTDPASHQREEEMQEEILSAESLSAVMLEKEMQCRPTSLSMEHNGEEDKRVDGYLLDGINARITRGEEEAHIQVAGTDIKHFMLLLLLHLTRYTNNEVLFGGNHDEDFVSSLGQRHDERPSRMDVMGVMNSSEQMWAEVLEKLLALPFQRLSTILSTFPEAVGVSAVPASPLAYLKESLRIMRVAQGRKGGSTSTYLLSCCLTHVLFGLRLARWSSTSNDHLFISQVQPTVNRCVTDPVLRGVPALQELRGDSMNYDAPLGHHSWAAWAWSWASSEFLAYYPSSTPLCYRERHERHDESDTEGSDKNVMLSLHSRSATSLHQLHLLWFLSVEGAPNWTSSPPLAKGIEMRDHSMWFRRVEVTLQNEVKKLKEELLPWLGRRDISRAEKESSMLEDVNECSNEFHTGRRASLWSAVFYAISLLMAGLRLLTHSTSALQLSSEYASACSSLSTIGDVLLFLVTVQRVARAQFNAKEVVEAGSTECTDASGGENAVPFTKHGSEKEDDRWQWEKLFVRLERYLREWAMEISECTCDYSLNQGEWTASTLLFRSSTANSTSLTSSSAAAHKVHTLPLCHRWPPFSSGRNDSKDSISRLSSFSVASAGTVENGSVSKEDEMSQNLTAASVVPKSESSNNNFYWRHYIGTAFTVIGQELYANVHPHLCGFRCAWRFSHDTEKQFISTHFQQLEKPLHLLGNISEHVGAESCPAFMSFENAAYEVSRNNILLHLPITIEEYLFQSSLEQLILFFLNESDLGSDAEFFERKGDISTARVVQNRLNQLYNICSAGKNLYIFMRSLDSVISTEHLGNRISHFSQLCCSENEARDQTNHEESNALNSLRLQILEDRTTSLYLFSHSQLQFFHSKSGHNPDDVSEKNQAARGFETTATSLSIEYAHDGISSKSLLRLVRQTVLCWTLASLLVVTKSMHEKKKRMFDSKEGRLFGSPAQNTNIPIPTMNGDCTKYQTESPLLSLYPTVLNRAKDFLAHPCFHSNTLESSRGMMHRGRVLPTTAPLVGKKRQRAGGDELKHYHSEDDVPVVTRSKVYRGADTTRETKPTGAVGENFGFRNVNQTKEIQNGIIIIQNMLSLAANELHLLMGIDDPG